MIVRGFLRTLGALLILCGLAAPAAAETAAEFYRGKVVKLVVGYGAGGGYDAYARLLAPHLERRLGATVVVENRPGGGGTVALNQVAAARPDGLSIMIVSAASAVFSQVLEVEGVRYDLDRLGLLGRVVDEKRVLVWSTQSSFGTLADVMNAGRAIRFSGTSRTSPIAAGSAFVAEALGLQASVVAGYKGSKEIALAAIRGEVDGFIPSDSSARRYGKEDGLVPFATISRERSPLLPEVPTIFEMTELAPARAWWIDYCEALFSLGRAFVTTPDLPADRLRFLQEAVADVLTDPAVVAEGEASKRPLNYADPEATRALIAKVMSGLAEEDIARVRHVALEKYK